MAAKMPNQLKTDTEKIAWLGNNIRRCLLAIEEATKQKAKAKDNIRSYEDMIRKVLKKEKVKE